MSEIDWLNENYLRSLAVMEQSWQQAVVKAVTAREDHRNTSHQMITALLHQLKERETLQARREEELNNLKASVTDLNTKLDLANSEIKRLLEIEERQVEDTTEELNQELQARNREIDELKAQHKKSIQELTSGTQETLLELENQLETVSAKEELSRNKISELEEVNKRNEIKLNNWNRVSREMCNELSEVKNKMQSIRFANTKLKEELGLWKKYCEKVESERKSERREVETENRVLKKFGQLELHLKSERTHRNLTVDLMNQFGNKLLKDLKQMRCTKEKTVKLVTVEIQTEKCEGEMESRQNYEHLELMKYRELQLEEALKKCSEDFENLRQQNLTLREVVRAMKQEREHWEKEKEQIEEEVRVTKLEESVRLLKSNLMNEEKEVCVWHALQDVKKEVSSLKNKNMNKSTNKDADIKKIEVPGVKFGVPKGSNFRK